MENPEKTKKEKSGSEVNWRKEFLQGLSKRRVLQKSYSIYKASSERQFCPLVSVTSKVSLASALLKNQ